LWILFQSSSFLFEDRHADLSQSDEQVEDVGVVVDHGTSLDIGGKLGLALSVQGLVEIILTLIELVLAQRDGPTWHQKARFLCGFFWVSKLRLCLCWWCVNFWVSKLSPSFRVDFGGKTADVIGFAA